MATAAGQLTAVVDGPAEDQRVRFERIDPQETSMPTGRVVREVNASIRAAAHLTELDRGAVENARALARLLDEAEARGFEEWHRISNNAAPSLNRALEGLGLTPLGRKGMAQPPATGGKLAQLRKAAAEQKRPARQEG